MRRDAVLALYEAYDALDDDLQGAHTAEVEANRL